MIAEAHRLADQPVLRLTRSRRGPRFGVALTAGIAGVGVWLLLDVDVVTAGLIGAVVGSTDAAAVFSIMRTTMRRKLPGQLPRRRVGRGWRRFDGGACAAPFG
jgi:NhaP-type Na+/H+ and K+/H+ antiporter